MAAPGRSAALGGSITSPPPPEACTVASARAAPGRVLALWALLASTAACSGGYATRVEVFQQRVATGDLNGAVAEMGDLIDEARGEDSPLSADLPLLLLERASVYQALGDHEAAVADLGEADPMLELLDLTPEGTETVGRYLWSDDVGVYRAPIYEKLMVNVAALASYLAMGDYAGARVEARRLTVLTNYFESTALYDHPMLGAAWAMAGLAMELSGEADEALRYYFDAFRVLHERWIAEAIARLGPESNLGGRPEVAEARAQLGLSAGDPAPPLLDRQVVVVVLSGSGPQRLAVHYPVGLVWGWVTASRYHLSPHEQRDYERLLAEQLLTWINFPILVVVPPRYQQFAVQVGGQSASAVRVSDITSFALAQWEADRGVIALAAISRAIVRVLAREAIQAAGNAIAGSDTSGAQVFNIASLLVEGGMQAADTPDTRTWTTMPGSLWIARLPAEAGPQPVEVTATGPFGADTFQETVDVPEQGSSVLVLRLLQ